MAGSEPDLAQIGRRTPVEIQRAASGSRITGKHPYDAVVGRRN